MPPEYFPNQILSRPILQDKADLWDQAWSCMILHDPARSCKLLPILHDPAGSVRPVAVKRENEHVEYRLNPGTNCKDFVAPDCQYIGCFSEVLKLNQVGSRFLLHNFNISDGSQISWIFSQCVSRSVSLRRRKSWQVGFPISPHFNADFQYIFDIVSIYLGYSFNISLIYFQYICQIFNISDGSQSVGEPEAEKELAMLASRISNFPLL